MFSFKTVVAEKGSALVMAILNITPDSFSDGGEAFSVDTVIEKVKNNYVYYYDPIFLFIRRVKKKRFVKKWSKMVCVYG